MSVQSILCGMFLGFLIIVSGAVRLSVAIPTRPTTPFTPEQLDIAFEQLHFGGHTWGARRMRLADTNTVPVPAFQTNEEGRGAPQTVGITNLPPGSKFRDQK